MGTQTFQSQLETLSQHIDKRFDDLQDGLTGLDERLRSLETKEASCSPLMLNRLGVTEKKIEQHERNISELTTVVMNSANSINDLKNILRWVLSVFTIILLAILSALATGQATIVFK
jgi:hypothetical protein